MRFNVDDYENTEWDERRVRDPYTPPIPRDPAEDGIYSTNPPDPGPGAADVPDFGEFEFPVYSGPSSPNIRIGPAPNFNAPRFRAPSFEQAMNDPGYRFREQAGREAMERSAAARGHLRTGGHFKDLAEWNQGFAAQEYRGVFDREMEAFGANYRAAYDEFAPRLLQWQQQSGADQASGLASFDRMWAQHMLNVENARWQDERIRELALANAPPPRPQLS